MTFIVFGKRKANLWAFFLFRKYENLMMVKNFGLDNQQDNKYGLNPNPKEKKRKKEYWPIAYIACTYMKW